MPAPTSAKPSVDGPVEKSNVFLPLLPLPASVPSDVADELPASDGEPEPPNTSRPGMEPPKGGMLVVIAHFFAIRRRAPTAASAVTPTMMAVLFRSANER